MASRFRFGRGSAIVAASTVIVALAAAIVALVMPIGSVRGQVIDAATGRPLPGAVVRVGDREYQTGDGGDFSLSGVRLGSEVLAEADGHLPASAKVSLGGGLRLDLMPRVLKGVILDESTGMPVANATVSGGSSSVATDERGSFAISEVSGDGVLEVKAPGYEPRRVEVAGQSDIQVGLRRFSARGVYLTYYGVGNKELTEHVLELADTTEINTVVIDVKGDRGWIAYKSDVPMVQQVGAQQEITMKDPEQFLADLKRRGVYTIARIVTFKDNPLATSRPDLAVINSATGRPWVDNEGLRWADPTRQEVWDYNIALATEAIDKGFDEVQFDYVRFPTDASAGNSLDSITFATANTMANRMAAINGFLEKARQAIHAHGGLVSADIFGYVVWRDDDMGIGQHLEDVAQHVDYVSPMVYPTLFWDGIALDGGVKYGDQQAGLYPYEIVSESMKVAVRRIGAEKLRPWLQYYNDYLTGKSYTAFDMELQKRAVYESGVRTWLFWDPSNRFNKGGFEPDGAG